MFTKFLKINTSSVSVRVLSINCREAAKLRDRLIKIHLTKFSLALIMAQDVRKQTTPKTDYPNLDYFKNRLPKFRPFLILDNKKPHSHELRG